MVRQLGEETGEEKGTVGRVADQLGCGVESLRSWIPDTGTRPSTMPNSMTVNRPITRNRVRTKPGMVHLVRPGILGDSRVWKDESYG